MRRHKYPRQEAARAEAANSFAAAVGPPRSRKKKPRAAKRTITNAMNVVAERIEAEEWSDIRPEHLVALYAVCHEDIYGVSAVPELEGEAWYGARSAAASMLRKEFDDDTEAAVEYLRWTWRREQSREKWRRDNGRPGGRITWRAQFCSRTMLTEYRIDQERMNG